MSVAPSLCCLLLALGAAGTARATWRVVEVGPRLHPRHGEAVVSLPDGRILLVGGSERVDVNPSRSTEIFDPTTRRFEAGPQLVVPRHQPAAVALGDGRVLVAGGSTLSYIVMSDTAEVIDLETWQSTLTGSMSVRRGEMPFLARANDREAVILGGTLEGRFGEVTDLVERWNAGTGRWTVDGRLQLPCSTVNCVQDGGTVLRPQGWHRCCGDPINAGCKKWIEVWHLRERRSELIEDPRATSCGRVMLVPHRPGSSLAVGENCGWWLSEVTASRPAMKPQWTLVEAPALAAHPLPPGDYLAAAVGDDDIVVATQWGVLLVHPESGRPWECLAPMTLRFERVVSVRRGMALILGYRSASRTALLVVNDEALQDSSLAPVPSTPKP